MSSPPQTNPDSVEALVGQIADEFTLRLNRGERPTVEEYAEKHPEIAELLREVLAALDLLHRPDVEATLADRDPNLNEPLGDFRLLREIGRGGMGIVYEAQQLNLGNRKVAVKVLPFASALDPRRLQRFKAEAEAAAKLNHEHIVPVYVIDCKRDTHFYAMQYIEGQSLAAIIAELRRLAGRAATDLQQTGPYLPAPFAPSVAEQNTSPMATITTEGSTSSEAFFKSVARLGQQAAKGLAHVHQEGIWHRDIKPANLLVDMRGNLWIADFGLAQMRSNAQLTRPGELVGTLRYMSPEQALARRVPIDGRTDVYSLGATLYELMTLEPVFKGSDSQELLRQIAFDEPRPPRRLNGKIPRDLETIVLKALAKKPEDRYLTAQEMGEDLYRYINDEPIKARPEPALHWVWRKMRQHAGSLLLGLSVMLTAAVLLFLVLFLNQPSAEERERRTRQLALASLTQDLEQQKKVILIGEHGSPGYFRVRTDPGPAKIVAAPDGAFSVQNWEHGLVELLPDPHLARYRFSAEVRHERQSHRECRVGIYFAHSEHPDGDTVAHFHLNVAFNDLVDVVAAGVGQGNAVGLQIHRQPPGGVIHQVHFDLKAQRRFLPAKPVGALGPWRTIAVEVRPESIDVFWEGGRISTTPRARLIKSASRLIARPRPLPPANVPQFAPRDGLGLYVSLGVASFRNVVVEPLGDEN